MGSFLTPLYKLSESLHTGIQHLDDDHRDLVHHVNLIAAAEQSADPASLAGTLAEFRAHLAKHFRSEEDHLLAAGYPKADSHARHHSEIIAALDRLIRDVRNGEPVGDVAATCYHELVSAVLLRDMQFLNWLADRQMGPS